MGRRARDLLYLLALTLTALLVHGFHPGAEDAEVYLPNVKQALHPGLYPLGAEFFHPYARLSLFPRLVEWSIRLTHLSYDWAIFLWYLGTIFLLLYACYRVAGLLFASAEARWAAVLTVAGLLTLPVAGTALYLMDQYVTSRSLVTPAVMLTVLYVIERKWWRAAAWFLLSALVHPLMAVFAGSYAVVLWWEQRRRGAPAGLAALLPFGISLGGSPSQAYSDALATRPYFFLQNWAWYEWLGAVAPILLFCWFARVARRRKMQALEAVSWAAAVYGAIYLAGAIVFTMPARFVGLAKLQPMRFLHLEYLLLVIVGAGLLGELLLRRRIWLWLLIFVPLFGGMMYASRQLFPATRQVEWPGADSGNRWVEAYVWSRDHTPRDAIFALDPRHMELAGADEQGFRVIAERSMLADGVKDPGVASMFPDLAVEWRRQYDAQSPWARLTRQDFLRLRQEFGVTWVVLQAPDDKGLACPYRNDRVMVCRVE